MTKFTLDNGFPALAQRVEPGTRNAAVQSMLPGREAFTHWWTVNVGYGEDHVFHVARGHYLSPRQFVVWYPNGKMHTGHGLTIKEALESALENAWLYI